MLRSFCGLALLVSLAPLHARGAERSPVVVELFTSEGCSSCPPADAVLEQLVRSQPVRGAEIIPLGFHVDYWNRLGWADPFSSAQFSQRQEEYSDAFGGNRVYTPQMVVDGSREFVGDEANAIRSVAEASARPKALVGLTLTPRCELSSNLKVSVGQLSGASAPELWVAVTESGLSSEVRRGENAGRTLRHTAVVRQLRSLGEIKSDGSNGFQTSTPVSVQKAWKRNALQVVAFVQQKKDRHILGVAAQPFCEAAR